MARKLIWPASTYFLDNLYVKMKTHKHFTAKRIVVKGEDKARQRKK